MRILVPRRVSHDAVEGSSAEDQTDAALRYQDEHPEHEIIFTDDVDFDVSGATPIEERKGIKPWLQPDTINEWDGMGVSDMDRLSRDLRLALNFMHDMIKNHGKVFIDFSDGTDSTELRGRQILEDRIHAAQRYREAVGEKRARKAQRLSDEGKWDGGRKTFGYKPVLVEIIDKYDRTRTWYDQEKDNDKPGTLPTTGGIIPAAPVAERMIAEAFAGEGYSAIARGLNADGIKTLIGREWSETSVERILTSPTLAGFVTKMEGPKGQRVRNIRRDRNGKPILFTDDPIIDEDRWNDLQDKLKANSRHRGQPQARHMLWGVVFCRNCSQPCKDDLPCLEHDLGLSGARRVKHVSKGNQYRCKSCGFMINLEFIEAYIEWKLLHEAGSKPLLVKKVVRAANSTADIVKLERHLERLRMILDSDPEDKHIRQSISDNEEKLAKLTGGPREADTVMLVPADPPITVAEHWASLTTPKAQNEYLRNTGAMFYADKNGIMGQLGWMELDDPESVFTGLRRMMSLIKMPTLETWDEVARHTGQRLPHNVRNEKDLAS